MARQLARLAAGACALALAACGLSVVGSATSDGGADAGTDAHPDADGDANVDANGVDASGDADSGPILGDAAPDSSACDAGAALVDGAVAARPAPAAIKLDGDLSEWSCLPFVRVDQNTAAQVYASAGGTTTTVFDFAVAWDPTAIYVAVHVIDSSVGGNATTNVYTNDAVEVYFDGDGNNSGPYESHDHQWVVDHANRVEMYNAGNSAPSVAGFSSAVKPTSVGYDVEMKIAGAALGHASFASGVRMGIDFAGDEGTGASQAQYFLVWHLNNAAGQQPSSVTSQFGFVDLVP